MIRFMNFDMKDINRGCYYHDCNMKDFLSDLDYHHPTNMNFCSKMTFSPDAHKRKVQSLISPFSMRVLVAALGHELAIEIGSEETVLGIKEKIEGILGVPVSSQTLAVCGWELLDGLDMDDYPIVAEGTRIDVSIKSSDLTSSRHCRAEIIVKFSSRRIVIEIDGTETVHSLKEKIHILEGTPVKRMSLFFSGRELEDDFRFLTEYGLRESSEVVVYLKSPVRSRDEPSTQRLGIVVQTSSSLLNSAEIPLEIEDSCTLNDLRQMLLSNKTLPPDDYIFIHKQRIMREQCSLRWHGVKNGDSLYVFRGTVTRSNH